MNLLLAFSPFILFVVIERLFGIPAGLGAGAIAAALLLVHDLVMPGRSPKLLEIGTFLLFGALALYALATGAPWSIAAVRLRVDRSIWNDPQFLRANYVISAAWAVAFAVLVLADVAMAARPALPHAGAVAATVLALLAAAWFTDWYPQRQRLAGRT